MSYFTPDVIAREQLAGAWSTSVAVSPSLPPVFKGTRRIKRRVKRRRRLLPSEFFVLVADYLEAKLKGD